MAYTPVRQLPDVDSLLKTVLRAATGSGNIFVEPPANLWPLVASAPTAIVYRFGGSSPYPRLADRATVQAISYGKSRKDAADLAETIRSALTVAAEKGSGDGDGYINGFTELVAPAAIPEAGLPANVWRFDATYSLNIRPVPH